MLVSATFERKLSKQKAPHKKKMKNKTEKKRKGNNTSWSLQNSDPIPSLTDNLCLTCRTNFLPSVSSKFTVMFKKGGTQWVDYTR